MRIFGALVAAAAAYFAVDAVSVAIPGSQRARVRSLVAREEAYNARPKAGEPATTRRIVDEADLEVDWVGVFLGGAASGLAGAFALTLLRASRRERIAATLLSSIGLAALLWNGGREPWSAPAAGALAVWLGFLAAGRRALSRDRIDTSRPAGT